MRYQCLPGIGLLLMMFVQGYGQSDRSGAAFSDAILKQHNLYRSEVGVPALVWSPKLAADAKAWANRLAKMNKMQHDESIRGAEGENLFMGTAGGDDLTTMVGLWGNEKKDFVYGVFPDCARSKSAVVGHYTQMIWKATQAVGCAISSNGTNDILVCRYAAPGNMIGQKPY